MRDQAFSVVKRPLSNIGAGRRLNAISEAILKTADDGGAILVELNGLSYDNVRSNFYTLAKRHGLRGHIQRDGEALIVWMEKKTDA